MMYIFIKNHIFILCFSFFFVSFVGAQTDEAARQNYIQLLSASNLNEGIPYYSMNNKTNRNKVEGSQYLDEEWKDGLIMTNEDELFRAKLKYDIHNDEMLFLSNDQKKALNSNLIKGVSIKDKIFINHEYSHKKIIENCFFQLLVSGEINLLVKYDLDITEGSFHPVLGKVDDGTVDVKIRKTYYYYKKEYPAVKLNVSKKNVLNVLGKRKNAISKYAKENKLNPKKENDLISLFSYYNE